MLRVTHARASSILTWQTRAPRSSRPRSTASDCSCSAQCPPSCICRKACPSVCRTRSRPSAPRSGPTWWPQAPDRDRPATRSSGSRWTAPPAWCPLAWRSCRASRTVCRRPWTPCWPIWCRCAGRPGRCSGSRRSRTWSAHPSWACRCPAGGRAATASSRGCRRSLREGGKREALDIDRTMIFFFFFFNSVGIFLDIASSRYWVHVLWVTT